MDEASGLVLRVLGGVGAQRDGASIDLGGRRQRAALAALVIARGRVVHTDRLVECVWSDAAPARPASALQSYISHLRRRLQPGVDARHRSGVITSAGAGYALRLPPEAVDAWRFEQALESSRQMAARDAARTLEQALSWWRGPPYPEYADEPWVEAEVSRLTELHAVAQELWMDARLSLGDAALAVPELEALVAGEPLREERWRLLVVALYRAQRQADALAALRRARETLAAELGVDPGPALRALEREILVQAPHLDGPPAAVVASTPQAPGRQRTPQDLAEREHETTVLAGIVDDLVGGGCGVVVVEGPPGIGKTRLLLAMTGLADAAGVTVLSGRGSPMERAFGFGVVRQLLEPALLDAVRRDDLLRGTAAGARGVFEDAADGERADGSFGVLHGLYWLVVNLAASGPLLLAVDDAQWCDTGSLRFLAYLVRRLQGLPIVVAATIRTGEPHADEGLLDELALDPSTVVVRPQPLSHEATGALVRERLGEPDDAFVGACHRTTAGNPLLVRQLLRALESQSVRPDVSHTDTVRAVGSRAVSSLVMLRLRRMPADATAVARAVAVLGLGADLPRVAVVARLPEDRAADALDLLCRSEVLNADGPLAFVHPLVRDAVYGDLPAAERALHHERAAEVLQRHGAAPEQIAVHLLEAPRRARGATVAVLRAAARTAADRGAPDSAVTFLRRALDEPVSEAERVAVLVELGLAEALVDGPAGVGHLTAAHDLLDDECRRAELAVAIARTQVFAAPPGVATDFAGRAADAAPACCADTRQGLQALQRISGFVHGLPPSTYRRPDPPAVDGDGDGARMLAATLAFERVLDGVDRRGAVELARFALADDRLLVVDSGLLWVVAATSLLLADADIGDFWERASAHAHAGGSLFAVLSVNVWRGFTQWRCGSLTDALESLHDAAEQQRMWGGSTVGAGYTAAFTAGVHVDRGDLEAAERVADAARMLPDSGDGTRLLRLVRARLRVAQRRHSEALDELDAISDPLGIANPAWAPWRSLTACALAGLGRRDEAIALADEEVARLRRWGAPRPLGASLRCAGELRGAAGHTLLREAVDLLTPTSATLELARARLALGRCPPVPDEEAVLLLERALAAARTCGARGVAHEARDALRQRGRRCELAEDGPEQPTGRQQRVRELAETGLSVHEIAQRLFLTPATVQAALGAPTARTSA